MMEFAVQIVDFLEVVDWGCQRHHRFVQAAQFGQTARVKPFGGTRGCQTFQGTPHRIHVDHVVERKLDDADAAIGHVFDQPFGLKLFERLADRGMAHAEFAGESFLAQPFTRTQLALRDHRAQPINDDIAQLFVVGNGLYAQFPRRASLVCGEVLSP